MFDMGLKETLQSMIYREEPDSPETIAWRRATAERMRTDAQRAKENAQRGLVQLKNFGAYEILDDVRHTFRTGSLIHKKTEIKEVYRSSVPFDSGDVSHNISQYPSSYTGTRGTASYVLSWERKGYKYLLSINSDGDNNIYYDFRYGDKVNYKEMTEGFAYPYLRGYVDIAKHESIEKAREEFDTKLGDMFAKLGSGDIERSVRVLFRRD